MNLSVIVVVAGGDSRMKSDLPWVLHPLAGRPMVSYVVEVCRDLEPVRLVIVVDHDVDLLRRALGDEISGVTQVQHLAQGHAIQQARQVIAGQAETVLVLSGDTPLLRQDTLLHMLQHHRENGAALTLLTYQAEEPSGYGRIVRDNATGHVHSVVQETDTTPEQRLITEVSSGIFCVRDSWLWPNLARIKTKPCGSRNQTCLAELVAMARDQCERVATMALDDCLEVIGLDDRAKLAQAEAEMRHRINLHWMLAGVTLVDPKATYIEAGVKIGSDSTIWPGTMLRGQTRVGRECTIGPSTVIIDSTIGDRCRVELSVVEQAVMEEGSGIGPFGHLRQGAHLGPGVHMGNFGEVKNSHLGAGAKMGHMSYLGDATVGAGANIGAGTITCNYDGKQKHRTIIGDGAFIGSDTMLVAPVEIGEGARTGAGSVVTRDVPPGSLAYGVPARVWTQAGSEESEDKQRGSA